MGITRKIKVKLKNQSKREKQFDIVKEIAKEDMKGGFVIHDVEIGINKTGDLYQFYNNLDFGNGQLLSPVKYKDMDQFKKDRKVKLQAINKQDGEPVPFGLKIVPKNSIKYTVSPKTNVDIIFGISNALKEPELARKGMHEAREARDGVKDTSAAKNHIMNILHADSPIKAEDIAKLPFNSTPEQGLELLYNIGYRKVNKKLLAEVRFPVDLNSPLTGIGCKVGKYHLKKQMHEDYFELIKLD